MLEILKNPNFDFLGKARICVALSLLVIVAGLAQIYRGGLRYGVEFSGGTQVIAKFQSRPEVDRVRDAVGQVAHGAQIQTFDAPEKNQVLVRVPGTIEGELTAQADAVLKALAANYSQNPVVESSTEIVGPIVGAELRQKAVYLTVLGLVFQLAYIAFRFGGLAWGSAATIAVFHDVLVTLALLVFAKFEITLNVIAALLTLVGYSVNDTIVIFDRVRENLKQRRKDSLARVINDSINQTLSRTLISNGTTFLAVLGLYVFGGEVLRGFAFTMVFGILVGTYSTIWIASPIVVFWNSLRDGRNPGTGAKAA
jgi:preprotein translocase subunit SecF